MHHRVQTQCHCLEVISWTQANVTIYLEVDSNLTFSDPGTKVCTTPYYGTYVSFGVTSVTEIIDLIGGEAYETESKIKAN